QAHMIVGLGWLRRMRGRDEGEQRGGKRPHVICCALSRRRAGCRQPFLCLRRCAASLRPPAARGSCRRRGRACCVREWERGPRTCRRGACPSSRRRRRVAVSSSYETPADKRWAARSISSFPGFADIFFWAALLAPDAEMFAPELRGDFFGLTGLELAEMERA